MLLKLCNFTEYLDWLMNRKWDKLLILDEMYRRVFFIQEEKFRMQLKEKHGAEYTI